MEPVLNRSRPPNYLDQWSSTGAVSEALLQAALSGLMDIAAAVETSVFKCAAI